MTCLIPEDKHPGMSRHQCSRRGFSLTILYRTQEPGTGIRGPTPVPAFMSNGSYKDALPVTI